MPGAAPPVVLRLRVPPTSDPAVPGIAEYVEAVTAHCPYLGPSAQRGLTLWELWEPVQPETFADDTADAAWFAVGLAGAERVRELARTSGPLVCANVAVRWSAHTRVQRDALAWPHWALKALYAPVGVMVGNSWKGETDTDRHGRPIPEPPVTFLSLRSAVRARDPRLMTRTPAVADIVADAVDDGRDVLAAVRGLRHAGPAFALWPHVKAWAADQYAAKGHVIRG